MPEIVDDPLGLIQWMARLDARNIVDDLKGLKQWMVRLYARNCRLLWPGWGLRINVSLTWPLS
jgi:hypothetical protein